MTIALYVVLI